MVEVEDGREVVCEDARSSILPVMSRTCFCKQVGARGRELRVRELRELDARGRELRVRELRELDARERRRRTSVGDPLPPRLDYNTTIRTAMDRYN
jgi:hypothetical protein